MNVAQRQAAEKRIARAFIREALKAGYQLKVWTGEELHGPFTSLKATTGTMFTVDEEELIVTDGTKRIGWVSFVYGNDGWDAICDYHSALEPLMTEVNKLTKKYL